MRHGEQGIALPLALFVLIVVSALVAGSFSLARLEQQSGRNTLFIVQAREAAEGGLEETLGNLDPVALEAMSVGAPPVSLASLSLEGATVVRDVQRRTAALFLVRARAERRAPDGTVLATRSLGALMRLVASADDSGRFEPQIVERGWFSLY
jgi:hypothetical protein